MALTSLVFLLAFFSGLGLCVARGPVYGLYTYVAVFYLHPPSRWWGAMLPDLRWSLLAALVTLLCLAFHKKRMRRASLFSYGLTWLFIAYVAWMWIQTVFALSPSHLTGVILFTKYLVLLYLIYEIVDSHDRVRDFLMAHVVGCFYLGWLAYTAPATSGGRLEGVGGPGIDDANTMSMHFGTGVIVASMLLMSERRWRFWLVVAALPFMLNGMIQGGSRGALVGLVAGGLCLFWLKPPAYRNQFLLFGALGALAFGYLANDVFVQRMSSLKAVTSEDDEALDFSARSRIAIVDAQWRMFFDHPFGAGYDGTTALSRSYLAPEYLAKSLTDPDFVPSRSSHNSFMSVVVDQGLPGIVLLTALVIWVWRNVGFVTRRSKSEPRVWGYGGAIAAALTVVAVSGQFAPYLKAEVQYWLLALLLVMRSLEDEERTRASLPAKSASDGPDVGHTAGAAIAPEAAEGSRGRRGKRKTRPMRLGDRVPKTGAR